MSQHLSLLEDENYGENEKNIIENGSVKEKMMLATYGRKEHLERLKKDSNNDVSAVARDVSQWGYFDLYERKSNYINAKEKYQNLHKQFSLSLLGVVSLGVIFFISLVMLVLFVSPIIVCVIVSVLSLFIGVGLWYYRINYLSVKLVKSKKELEVANKTYQRAQEFQKKFERIVNLRIKRIEENDNYTDISL